MDAYRVKIVQQMYNESESEWRDNNFVEYVSTLAMAAAIVKRMKPEENYRRVFEIKIEYIFIQEECKNVPYTE